MDYTKMNVPGIPWGDFVSGANIGWGIAYYFKDCIAVNRFRCRFDSVFFLNGNTPSDKERVAAFFSDFLKINGLIGYSPDVLDIAAAPLYAMRLSLDADIRAEYAEFGRFIGNKIRSKAFIDSVCNNEAGPFPDTLCMVELLKEYDKDTMMCYVARLVQYVKFVAEHHTLDEAKVSACLASLEAMTVSSSSLPNYKPKVQKKRSDYLFPPFRLWTGVEIIMNIIGAIVAILLFALFVCAEYPIVGAIVSLFLLLIWMFFVFTEGGGYDSGYSGHSSYSGGSDSYSDGEDVSFESDMTKNYYGRHGEFDSNDEDRANCEEMFGMRSQNHNADIQEQYGWENKVNYDSDGYADEEDW